MSRAADLVSRWRQHLLPSSPESMRIEAAEILSEHCTAWAGEAFQNAAADQGCIELLVQFATTAEDIYAKMQAFQALAQICFNNERVSHKTCSTEGFIDIVLLTIRDPSEDTDLKETALRSATNSAGNTWPNHPKFYCLLPPVVAILSDPYQSKDLRAETVGFLNVLAYNEASRRVIISHGAVEPLVAIMRTDDIHLEYTTAAIAVANLVGHIEDHPALACGAESDLFRQLVTCFRNTLAGHDFPRGSGLYFTSWKLSMGIANLCRNGHCKEPLCQAGILPLLKTALDSNNSHNETKNKRLARHSLMALWSLME